MLIWLIVLNSDYSTEDVMTNHKNMLPTSVDQKKAQSSSDIQKKKNPEQFTKII